MTSTIFDREINERFEKRLEDLELMKLCLAFMKDRNSIWGELYTYWAKESLKESEALVKLNVNG
jgi:hypothetical protein